MKQKILAVFLACVFVLSLAACGAKKDYAENVDEEPLAVSEQSQAVGEQEKEDSVEAENTEISVPEEKSPETPSEIPEASATETQPSPAPEVSENTIRPEFQAAMDSYLAFMQEYVDFMQKMKANPDDLTLLSEYTDYMQKYTDYMEDLNAVDESELTDAELVLYLDTTNQIEKMLLTAAN